MTRDRGPDGLPPKLARTVARWLAPADRRDEIDADLIDNWRRWRAESRRDLRRALWRDALSAARLRWRVNVQPAPGRAQGVPMLQDITVALRIARRQPGVTATIVLTLALGLGAATAIFSVAYAIWLKPSPFGNVTRLVTLRETRRQTGLGAGLSLPSVQAVRRGAGSLAAVATYVYGASSVDRDGERQRVVTYSVSPQLFDVLGTRPALGRGFVSGDELRTNGLVAVVSDRFWRQFLHASPQAIGTPVSLATLTFTVIGVMPRDFHFPQALESDLWLPLNEETANSDRAYRHYQAVAVMKDEAPLDQLRSELAGIADVEARAFPSVSEGWTIVASRVRTVSEGVRSAFGVLLVSVAVLLAIACANIAGVLMARLASRSRELATRAALGASRGQLVRLVLVESTLWSSIGGAAGILAAGYLVPVLVALMPKFTPRAADARLDGSVLVFGCTAALATGLMCGLAPALRASRQDAQRLGRRVASRYGGAAHAAIVAAEVALSVVLLVGGALMMKSFSGLMARDRGFAPAQLLSAHLTLPFERFQSDDARRAIVEEISTRVLGVRGVASVGAVTGYPGSDMGYLGAGLVMPAGATGPATVFAAVRACNNTYFTAMKARVLEGRVFTAEDERAPSPKLVISRTLAAKLWPGVSAVGKRLTAPQPLASALPAGAQYEVIGVIKDMSDDGAGAVELFLPLSLSNAFWFDLVVRTQGDPAPIARPVRDAIKSIAGDFSIERMETMRAVLTEASALEHAQSVIVLSFAALSAGLSAIGLFGLLSYTVSLRTSEIGLRMALGATPTDIFRSVLWQGVWLVGIGLAIGGALVAVLIPMLGAHVFGLQHLDPWTLTAVPVMLLVTALAAAYIPARRALRIDPLISLRD